MTLLQVIVDGQPRISEVIKAVDAAFDPVVIMDEGAALLLGRIRRRFLQQVDPEGVPWIPSKAATKRAKGRGGGTLFKTGRLFSSMQLAGATPDERYLGTDVPYGVYHNEGRPDANLPKREFFGFGEQDASVVERLVIKRLSEALGDIA